MYLTEILSYIQNIRHDSELINFALKKKDVLSIFISVKGAGGPTGTWDLFISQGDRRLGDAPQSYVAI